MHENNAECKKVLIDEKILQQALHTRFPSPLATNTAQLSNKEKIALIAEKFQDIMEILGLDLSDESLQQTPLRVAKMYVEEVFSGLDPSTFPRISFTENLFQYGQRPHMVFVQVEFCSFCEHHFVPIEGTASVAYLPNSKLIGLSTIPHLVRFFARRPQVQERLTAQIADSLSLVTDSPHVAVSLRAQHHCMTARGVESSHSHAITNVMRGEFESDQALRQEFFAALNG